MTKTDDTTPATKADIHRLESQIQLNTQRLCEHDEKFDMLVQLIHDKTEEMKRHFDVVAESLRLDVMGIFGDRTDLHHEQLLLHEQRISRLERVYNFEA